MSRLHFALALAAAGMLATQVNAAQPVVFPLYSNNFNGASLGDSVNERQGFPIVTVVAVPDPNTSDPVANAYSAAGPAGWSVDNNFDAFGNVDLAYDGVSLGDPNVADLAEGIAPTVGTVIGNTGLLNQGDPNHGVDEWEGWTFADKDFWIEAAGDQDRSLFTKSSGNVAVFDPDEYDDLGDGRGGAYMNSGLTMPNVPIGTNTFIQLSYDYSFRAEAFDDSHDPNGGSVLNGLSLNNSTASTYITYKDAGGSVLGTNVLSGTLIDSDGGNGTDPNAADFRLPSPTLATASDIDGTFTGFVPLAGGAVPAGAASFDVTFGLINAGNDWWYAIDNVTVQGNVDGVVVNEDFDSLALVDSVNEQRSTVPSRVTALNSDTETTPRPNSFSPTAPGWTVDNSATPADTLGDNNIGVLEFEGWNFMDLDFWTFADDQQRSTFTNSSGVFAVADGDEWDDLGDPTDADLLDPNGAIIGAGGLMDTTMTSDSFSVAGAAPGELFLSFDSSWRDEDDNTAIITVTYDGDPNTTVEILRFESDSGSAFFKDDAPNESLTVALQNPAGASTAELSFRYIGGNDWWWAVDNIAVGTIPEPATLGMSLLGALGFGLVRRRK